MDENRSHSGRVVPVICEYAKMKLFDNSPAVERRKPCTKGLRSMLSTMFDGLEFEETVSLLNDIRRAVSEYSPFKDEPVDFVEWVLAESVKANDYNPNTVAPPEMELLRVSIRSDGYTQPIVTDKNEEDRSRVVIDGFHRNRVGRECVEVREKLKGYLPVVQIRSGQKGITERMASTIRHNRARGKHGVEAMSDIVIELKRRNWTDDRIGRELGMDPDEILRLTQITGLTEMFADQEFSKSWDVEGEITESDFTELTGEQSEDEVTSRTVNTNDPNRVFHTHDKWECYRAGFYNTTCDGRTKEECEEAYRSFLSDNERFSGSLEHVVAEWKHSCEHYLTNTAMNRIAWLGQAAACHALGIPSTFRGGFHLLSGDQQKEANEVALRFLNKWLTANGRDAVTMEEAYSYDRQSDIY